MSSSGNNSFKKALFPPRCFICGDFTRSKYSLCDECSTKFNITFEITCEKCGLTAKSCQCEEYEYHFEGVVGAFKNEGAAQHGIYQLKFNGKKCAAKYYGEILSQIISKKFRDKKFDLITEIPLSPIALAFRGYNQSTLLANEVANRLKIHRETLLKKRSFVKSQHNQELETRFKNVFGKYKMIKGKNIKDKRVLLIDDIKTTGATLDEAARILRLSGAKEVYCACVLITYKFYE
ncbi:MAG: ComF family protein [Oscillospiraceae bacterium]|nr:ComF family protein [Candidatus Equicaccousia limihippi]